MRSYGLFVAAVVILCTSATAQIRPIFDPDDFVDPRQHEGPVFGSRLVAGAASDFVDDYRPLNQSASFLHLVNSFYWKSFELDYKHSEVFADRGSREVTSCGCSPPIYFPTPSTGDSTPSAPPQSSKETVQFGWYHSVSGGPVDPPVMLRYRLSWSRQAVHTTVRSGSTDDIIARLSGREQSLGIDADTFFRVRGHDIYGSVFYAQNVRSGTIDDRRQQELAYMARFPGTSYKSILMRATMTVGAISNRGAAGLNLVNPAFEALWHHHASRVNVHLIWSPLAMRSGAAGWETHQQVVIYVDRGYVKLFGKPSG
jgi:hypothetical protein